MQFILEAIAASSEDALAARLHASFKPKSDLFRLTDLGFSDATTTRGQSRSHTCLQLVDSILTDGFITQMDPILVWKNPQTLLKPMRWQSYIKGHTRACTAPVMAIIMMQRFSHPENLIAVGGGGLLESLKVIRVRVAIVAPDLMAVAFKNALLAHRGSIRQAHDVLNWIQKLEQVSASTGTTPDDVLTKWNSECPAEARAVGNKRLCCMNPVKNIHHECRKTLIDHASKFGQKSAFTDDAFT